MTKSLPPLTWFRAFEASARHLSFTAAASELGLTQSAISQQVRSLELRFGTPLFTRLPRGLSLTDTGRRLLPGVTESIAGLTRVTRAFQPETEAGTLIVAASISFAQQHIAPRLPTFLAEHPGARVRLRSALWPDEFSASVADVEIRFGTPDLPKMEVTGFGPDHLIPVAAPGLVQKYPTWPDLGHVGLIASTGTSDNWDSWARTLDLPPPENIRITVDSYGLALDLARAGSGVALTSQTLAAPMLQRGELVIALRRRCPAKDQFFISRKPEAPAALADRFVDWLVAGLAADRASAEAIWRKTAAP